MHFVSLICRDAAKDRQFHALFEFDLPLDDQVSNHLEAHEAIHAWHAVVAEDQLVHPLTLVVI